MFQLLKSPLMTF